MNNFENGQLTGLKYKALIGNDNSQNLVYLVHGRAGNREVMWAFRRTLPENCNIVSVEAPEPDPIGGFSWWPVQPNVPAKSYISTVADSLIKFINEFEMLKGLKPQKRLALGFSQGAGLLSVVVQKEPSLFSAIGLLAGFVILLDESSDILAGPSVFMAHGNLDQVISIEKAKASHEMLLNMGLTVEFHSEEVGHKVGAQSMRALKQWLLNIVG